MSTTTHPITGKTITEEDDLYKKAILDAANVCTAMVSQMMVMGRVPTKDRSMADMLYRVEAKILRLGQDYTDLKNLIPGAKTGHSG